MRRGERLTITTKDIAMTYRLSGRVTLADGETESQVFHVGNTTLSGVQVPPEFSGTELTFQASIFGDAFGALNKPDGGTAVTIPVTAGEPVYLDPVEFNPFAYFRIVSDVEQSGDIVIEWSAVEL